MKIAKLFGVFALAALIAVPAMAQPANDTCAGAIELMCGVPVQVDTTGATDDAGQPLGSCWAGPTNESIYFKFTATDTSATLSLCTDIDGGDGAIAIYAVDPNAPCDFAAWTEVPCGGCSEDVCGFTGWNPETCADNLTVGQEYYVMMKNWGWSGVYQFDLDCTACGPTATGACCDIATGVATIETQCVCENKLGSRYDGDGTVIGDVECVIELGACCDTVAGDCQEGVLAADCVAKGGDWRFCGIEVACADCDPPCKPRIPTVSEWGLVLMTLIGLTAGTILFNRRRQVAVV